MFHFDKREWYYWNIPQMIVRFKNGEQEVKRQYLRVGRFLNDWETKSIYMDMRSPIEPFDHVEIEFWNRESNQQLNIDKLNVIAFNGKNKESFWEWINAY